MTMKPKMVDPVGEASRVAASGYEQTVEALSDGMAKASAGFEKTQAQMKEGVEKVMQTAEQLMAFNQGNFEAVVKSGKIWTTGVQDLSKQVVASAQASLDETLASFRALAGVKSLREAVDLQTTLARSAVEKAVTETGRITDASVKLAEQAIAPLTARFAVAMETFGKAA